MAKRKPRALKKQCIKCGKTHFLHWFRGRNKTCEVCLGYGEPAGGADDVVVVPRPRRSRRWWPKNVVDQKGRR